MTIPEKGRGGRTMATEVKKVTVTCPHCQKVVEAWSYDGKVEGRCFVTGKQVSIVLSKKE